MEDFVTAPSVEKCPCQQISVRWTNRTFTGWKRGFFFINFTSVYAQRLSTVNAFIKYKWSSVFEECNLELQLIEDYASST